MNFLAHLHLATLADSSLLGNLMADFVRGNPQDSYADEIVAGIRLHRRVDSLTDSLPEVKQARQYFSDEFRRVAPITLDVLWDHYLARHWLQLVPDTPLQTFIDGAQSQIEPHLAQTPERFQNLNLYLWPERWMTRYAELPFIADVLHRMSVRRPKLAALSGSFQDIELHYHQFEILFWQFYPRMMQLAKTQQL
ncbi:ACP phosphodiesterase [Pectobacterium peruviense]|uniref:ACP phosphodiesterase n=1 Tax=Pectobacterium peruviense TaxID=2066479 RepID=A0ABX4S7Z9_9GAMM|nr:ACP phosphodiesterase [Pectobacterium peruviense]KML68816.1 ACP phosphodiesterase [Pectobacterium peruviense]PKX83098.1 ACP phosphodiesterase [Pectobacterium peruviense]PKX85520.1 ACP phosphodiesterase [Pectobacterium peruviense]